MKKPKYKCPVCGYYNAHQLGCPEVDKKIKLCDIIKDYKVAKENGDEYKLPPNL